MLYHRDRGKLDKIRSYDATVISRSFERVTVTVTLLTAFLYNYSSIVLGEVN